VLAEDIVNGTGLLPNYYATAPLWNRYREELLRLRERPEVRSHWEETRKTGADLTETVDQLVRSLRSIRQGLSLEYDLPLVQASQG
jgi:hypothetical protein